MGHGLGIPSPQNMGATHVFDKAQGACVLAGMDQIGSGLRLVACAWLVLLLLGRGPYCGLWLLLHLLYRDGTS